MSLPTDPFADEGYQDYWDGVDKSECPYEEGTDGAAGWLRGWKEADEE